MTSTAPPAARPSGRRELWLRVASGVVLAPAILAALVYGGWPFAGIWLAAGIIGFAEWMVMSRTEPREVLIALGAATLGALLLCQRGGAPALACLAVLLLGAAACATVARTGFGRVRTLAGVLGAAAIASVPVALRDDPGIGLVGPAWMFAVVWSTDIAAYFAGRKIGGPKLMPRVSPNKTWSGAIGGLVGAVAAGSLVAVAADLAGLDLPSAASLPVVAGVSALASVLSQAGDLLESGLKRRYGVKDSGKIIPGHGGVMDRLDGFFAVAVLAGLYLALRGSGLIP
ncbi:phosphatidate cytidylyltransferase [Methylobacterium brachiatum]|uniref:Phosphatidate cytidylyltransferase n=1 Tax=Methylobacterium brachiatum TaxID=269660 RepID=A0AAJ1TSD6_9HYPH|nr:phosphatidate cytidylyltransferase [Methylobacterium brachiatum]MCB4802017.1 phosphatidate cytidylyltransferase [Methylobacterium brachiatum]MDQ0542357.1 phosphatidate cytidylyltransferase [Methylobacterium brachiatum]